MNINQEINQVNIQSNIKDYSYNRALKELSIDSEHAFEGPHFIVSLQNRDFYRGELENIPYRRFLDLIEVIKYSPEDLSKRYLDENAFRDVTNEDLNILGITEEELFEIALNNSENYFIPMFVKSSDLIDDYDEISDNEAFFLTNKPLIYGASILRYHDINKYIYDRVCDDYYVIPANINEVFVMAKSFGIEMVMGIRREIEMINHFILDTNMYLSNNFYYYDHKEDNMLLFEVD